MAVYTFVNGTRKRVFSNKPCVFINGVKHTIGKCYTFVNGTRKQIFDTWSLKNEELFLSNGSVILPFGTYEFVLRGGGGAGGNNGATNKYIGGYGGAGEYGEIKADSFVLAQSKTVNFVVGQGGKDTANGGNGGTGGSGSAKGGDGGGGGHASYLKIDNTYTTAQGGGGGGGGGAGKSGNGRYRSGGGGGGGGGYYHTVNGTETGYAGGNGGNTGVFPSDGNPGAIGHNEIFSTETVFSGAGSSGSDRSQGGGRGNLYCGAGGGGGGSGNNDGYAWGGSGGGGAGGSPNAGGGQGGDPANGVSMTPLKYQSRSATNHFATPIDTLPENSQHGVNANYGVGGASNENGSQGFVLIKRVA